MPSTLDPRSARGATRLLSALAASIACLAALRLLGPTPLADAFFAGWVLVGVGLSLVGAGAAWTDRTPLVWAAALLLTGLSVAGMWSIGPFFAPAAALLLAAAALSHRIGPGPRERAESGRPPSTKREAALQTLAGTASVALGAWLVYASAVARGLFGACAAETVNCALAQTRWAAVGATVLGLLAVGFGGWLVWRRVAGGRALATARRG